MVRPDRFELAVLPTPLQHAPRLQQLLGSGPVWIKRDDLTGFGVAGNKARTLEFLLGDALACGADTLVVTGAPGSNFCAAAALAARVAGLDCAVLHCGTEPATPSSTVRLARAAGANLRFDATLAREDLDAAVCHYAEELRAGGRRPYPVPRGGATAVGALGSALAAAELADQCRQAGFGSCTVVLPTGSGTTQAGLLAGRAGSGWPLRIIGASVSRPAAAMRSGVFELARDCVRLLGGTEPELADVDVRDAVGSGFGVAATADRISAEIGLTAAGLLLDDTYAAKAMTLLRELADEVREPLVFWHTGGVSGALAALTRRTETEQYA